MLTEGDRFGGLVLICCDTGRPLKQRRYNYWLCRCDCGGGASVPEARLRNGLVIGCYDCQPDQRRGGDLYRKRGRRLSRGKWGSPPGYTSWQGMLRRCRNPKASNYSYYGGRGIRVCERWETFENFYADMGPRPPGMSLDRIDVDGHYEPGNCRWATKAEQNRNTRRTIPVIYQGVGYVSLSVASAATGRTRDTIKKYAGQAASFLPLDHAPHA